MAIHSLNEQLNNPTVVTLRSMMGAGNPLGCLTALLILGPLPVLTKVVAFATEQDERSAKKGLSKLAMMGMAANTVYGNSDGWTLTAQAYQLPLVVELTAKNAVSLCDAGAENRELTANFAESHAQPAKNAVSSPQSQSQLITINTDSNSDGWPKSKSELEAAYLEVLAAGPVYLNIRRPLASRLSERPDFLRHLLAHLARAKSGRTDGYAKPGVYLRDHAEACALVSDSDLPHDSLTFSEAMRWAANGGKTDAQLASEKIQAEHERQQAEQDARKHEAEQAELNAQSAAEEAARALQQALVARQAASIDPVLDAPLAADTHQTPRMMWEAALGQLRLEMPRNTFETWLQGARLIAYADHAFVIGVRDKHRKDWLENRLAGTVRRALSGLIGKPISVRFDLDSNFVS